MHQQRSVLYWVVQRRHLRLILFYWKLPQFINNCGSVVSETGSAELTSIGRLPSTHPGVTVISYQRRRDAEAVLP